MIIALRGIADVPSAICRSAQLACFHAAYGDDANKEAARLSFIADGTSAIPDYF
jgi:hypothetical protein